MACSYDLWTAVASSAAFSSLPGSLVSFAPWEKQMPPVSSAVVCGFVCSAPRWLRTTHTQTEAAAGQRAASAQRWPCAGISISRSCVSGCLSNTGVLWLTLTSAHLHPISVNSQSCTRGREAASEGERERSGVGDVFVHVCAHCHLKHYSSFWISLALIAFIFLCFH